MNDNSTIALLQSLRADVFFFKESIKEVSEEILKENISKYPIYIAHQLDIDVGEPILDRQELATTFSINASTLEEFESRGIIQKEKIDFFKKNFKDPHKFICIFLVANEEANFVYIPFDLKQEIINPQNN